MELPHKDLSATHNGPEKWEYLLDFRSDTVNFCWTKADAKYVVKHSNYTEIWSAFITFTTFTNYLLQIYAVCFCDHTWPTYFFGYLFDICFVCNIVLVFHLPYYNYNGILVVDRRKIARRYMRTRFLIDVASVVPLEFLAPLFKEPLRALRYFRLNRLIQIVRTVYYFCKLYS